MPDLPVALTGAGALLCCAFACSASANAAKHLAPLDRSAGTFSPRGCGNCCQC